jgi:hypothetical protein
MKEHTRSVAALHTGMERPLHMRGLFERTQNARERGENSALDGTRTWSDFHPVLDQKEGCTLISRVSCSKLGRRRSTYIQLRRTIVGCEGGALYKSVARKSWVQVNFLLCSLMLAANA